MMPTHQLYISLVFLALSQCEGRSGWSDQRCTSSSQCPSFSRTRCQGNTFWITNICLGRTQRYSAPGRCVRGRCAECEQISPTVTSDINKDCGSSGNRMRCRNFKCLSRFSSEYRSG